MQTNLQFFFRRSNSILRKLGFLFLLYCSTSNAQTVLLSPTGDGGFETGATFASNGWTSAGNPMGMLFPSGEWYCGSVVRTDGARGAYIDINGGSGNSYIGGFTPNTSHLYRTVTFPAGATDIILKFKWKAGGGIGITGNDELTVHLIEGNEVVEGGTLLATGLIGTYRGQGSSAQQATITIPNSAAGTTKKLVFSWSDQGNFSTLLGVDPGASIDEVSITYGGGTPNPTCAAPTGVAASNISTSGATFTWNAVTGATGGYEYVLDQNSTDPAAAGTGITTTTYTSTSTLTAGATYYFHVRANCGSGNFSPWTTISFVVSNNPPVGNCDAPANLNVTSITSYSAFISWTPVSSASHYEYAIDQSSTAPTGAGTPINLNTYSANGLTDATTYYFHVRTNCNGTFSQWSTISFTTATSTGCLEPADVLSSDITTISATITWTASAGSLSHQYVFNQLTTPPTTSGTTITGSTYNATGLSPATYYSFHIRSMCSGGASNWVTHRFITAGSVGIKDIDKPVFACYPNPVSNMLSIKFAEQPSKSSTIQIADITGTILAKHKVNSDLLTIDMQNIASGVYFVKYTNAEGTLQVHKIMKQ